MKARELIEQLMRLDLDCQVFVEVAITGDTEHQTAKAPIEAAAWHNEDGNPHLRIKSSIAIEITVQKPAMSVVAN